MTRTAFVTGGSGFIGGHLIRRLKTDGWDVRALARSDASAAKVHEAGASPVRGDLDQLPGLASELSGCEVAFHAAAHVGEADPYEVFERVNVAGTTAVISACRRAGVRRLVHVSSEAAILAGEPLVHVNEDAPLRPDSKVPYCATKALAEQAVLQANGDGLETVVVRPRMVWGPGDTTLLAPVAEAVRKKRFRWIGDGQQLTETTHVDNAVHGLVLATDHGPAGGRWFVTDGEPVVFRNFITDLVGTQGLVPTDKRVPAKVALAVATVLEGAWPRLHLPGAPPVTRFAVWIFSLEVTIDISRARDELGYAPVRTRADGLAQLRAANGA